MQTIFFAILFYIVIGGVGMYLGNRKVDTDTGKQRWLKYTTYIFITGIVIISILYNLFWLLASMIALIGYWELIKARSNQQIFALVIYSLIITGFLFFAFQLKKEFQFFLYFQILTFDAFSQVTGQLIGRTKMVRKISPAKTWEGFAGGIVFCILSSIFSSSYLNISIAIATLLGFITSLTGFGGDILASFYKRMAGIKDYSNLLPGQGGFLDRFDSFMMSAFCYSIIYLFNNEWVV